MESDERISLLRQHSPTQERNVSWDRRRFYSKRRVLYVSGFVAFILCLILFFQSVGSSGWPTRNDLSLKELQTLLKSTPDTDEARRSNEYYSSGPHLAGANLSQVLWTKDLWATFGVESQVVSYEVYLNRPVSQSLTLLQEPGSSREEQEPGPSVLYEAKLAEAALPEDPASCDPRRIPTFHGYSASGSVTAQYVFVNYGTYQDYEDLVNANVSLKGKIAIAKYDRVWRGMKVLRAQELGMEAVVIYTDPGNDYYKEADGYKPYPFGPARQPSSVQRGSVLSINWQPGDPTTPGYPSLPGAPRIEPENMLGLAKIPSLPISFEDAIPLLRALNDHGPLASSLGESWKPGGLQHEGVQYNIGPSPANLVLRVTNEQAYEITPIHNLIGVINGTNTDEVVILGNHHDSWTLGGAGDPHSGSAALNEIVRSFGKALEKGWKPRRTLIFARWDSEEYGMTGSTEWVEQYLPWLSGAGIAYLNSDPGVTGSEFHANAAPLVDHVILRSANSVLSPNQTVPGQTLGDLWYAGIATLGGGSDYSAFLDHAGVSSLDLGFRPAPDAPTYHYHSNYDSITYMEKIIDPKFAYHVALAQVWGLIAAELVEKPIIPFNTTHYASSVQAYIKDIRHIIRQKQHSHDTAHLSGLSDAADRFFASAKSFDERTATLSESLEHINIEANWYFWRRDSMYSEAERVNKKLRALERQFLFEQGLDGRPWFKHTIFAPGFWEGYAGVTLPGLRERVQAEDDKGIKRWEDIIVEALGKASALLDG